MTLLPVFIMFNLIFIVIFDKASSLKQDNTIKRRHSHCDCGRLQNETAMERMVSHPWIASLFYDGSFLCGGVIVDTQYILTAAHCFSKKMNVIDLKLGSEEKIKRFKVVLNKRLDDKILLMLSVTKIIVHEKYAYNGGKTLNDIALAKIAKPIIFNLGIRPICLPHESVSELKGINARATGWGSKKMGDSLNVVLKKEVKLPIISNRLCKKLLKDGVILDTHICAGGVKGKDLCNGDSGAPLYVTTKGGRVYLVGIANWGEGCGIAKKPGVYARVSAFVNWIRRNTLDSAPCKNLLPPVLRTNSQDCGIPEESCSKDNTDCQNAFRYSWMAKILRKGKYVGSGVLIHRSYVLTSSVSGYLKYGNPCKNMPTSKLKNPMGGKHRKETSCQQARNLNVHLGMRLRGSVVNTSLSSNVMYIFCRKFPRDSKICLLKLSPEMDQLLLLMRPVCLPSLTDKYSINSEILLQYWKKKKDNSYPSSFVATPGKVKAAKKCGGDSKKNVRNGKICTHLGGKYTCQETGDVATRYKSGRHYLVGFLSSNNREKCSRMKVFDLIQDNIKWIRNVISETFSHKHTS